MKVELYCNGNRYPEWPTDLEVTEPPPPTLRLPVPEKVYPCAGAREPARILTFTRGEVRGNVVRYIFSHSEYLHPAEAKP